MVHRVRLSNASARVYVPRPCAREGNYEKGDYRFRGGDRAQPAREKRTASRMAKRGLKRGRWLVTGGLIAFVVVSAAVIARRSYGHKEGVELTALQRRKTNLESERVRLSQVIRNASSSSVILPIAERRLKMHLPSESQMVFVKRAARTGGTP